jgi:hypothetical protein
LSSLPFPPFALAKRREKGAAFLPFGQKHLLCFDTRKKGYLPKDKMFKIGEGGLGARIKRQMISTRRELFAVSNYGPDLLPESLLIADVVMMELRPSWGGYGQ